MRGIKTTTHSEHLLHREVEPRGAGTLNSGAPSYCPASSSKEKPFTSLCPVNLHQNQIFVGSHLHYKKHPILQVIVRGLPTKADCMQGKETQETSEL